MLTIAPLPRLATEATSRPASIVVLPVAVLLPVRVSVPVPDLISWPLPLMAWAKLASPAWFSSSCAMLTIAPLARLVAEATRRPDAMPVRPVEVLVPVSVSVPLPDLSRWPLPLMSCASTALLSCFSCNAASLTMAPLPRLAVETTSSPSTMRVPPVDVLAPVSVSVPAPVLVSSPLPPIDWARVASLACFSSSAALLVIAPLPRFAAEATRRPASMVVPPVEVLAPASVSVPAPDLISSPLPPRAWASTALSDCWISSAALLVIAPLARWATPATRWPASIAVPPVAVFVPASVSVPVPDLIRSPLPLIAPLSVMSWLPCSVRLPEMSTALARFMLLVLSSAALPVAFSVPPLNAPALPRRSVPALSSVLPR